MKKVYIVFFLLLQAFVSNAFAPGDSESKMKGLDRTVRVDGKWDWGTNGHGTYEEAIEAFKAQNDISVYNANATKYRVFTRGSKNYVEMICGFRQVKYTYTTLNTGYADNFVNDIKSNSADSKAAEKKLNREFDVIFRDIGMAINTDNHRIYRAFDCKI